MDIHYFTPFVSHLFVSNSPTHLGQTPWILKLLFCFMWRGRKPLMETLNWVQSVFLCLFWLSFSSGLFLTVFINFPLISTFLIILVNYFFLLLNYFSSTFTSSPSFWCTLKCTIQWFLIDSQSCATNTTIQNIFITLNRNSVPISSHSPPSPPGPATTNFCFYWFACSGFLI